MHDYVEKRGGPFDFWEGGGGVGRFPATQWEREKKSCSVQSRKKNHAKESAQKKIPTYKSTDALHFSIVSTGLQDFAFLSRHICLKEHGVNSGQLSAPPSNYRLSGAPDNITGILPPLEPLTYDSQWRSLHGNIVATPWENLGLRYVQVYLTIIRRRRGDYRGIFAETKSR
jgi:hypothetical protein